MWDFGIKTGGACLKSGAQHVQHCARGFCSCCCARLVAGGQQRGDGDGEGAFRQ